MEFQDRFATEAACLDYLAASRWPEGFICPGCGGHSAWGLERRHLWECTACSLQTSVTAGTVMHRTRTPLRTWFWAAYLVATHHPGISAKQLQRQLGLSRYETAWVILQKLRRAMVRPRAQPPHGRSRDRRVLARWLRGRPQRQPPARQEGLGRCRDRGPRSRLGTLAPSGAGQLAREDVGGIHECDYGPSGDRPHRRAVLLRRAGQARLSAPPAQTDGRQARRRTAAASAPSDLLRLPPQPPRHPDGCLPDPSRTRRDPRPHNL
jgi:hypothetical protein